MRDSRESWELRDKPGSGWGAVGGAGWGGVGGAGRGGVGGAGDHWRGMDAGLPLGETPA